MLKSLLALASVGSAADINKQKKMYSMPINRGPYPFSKKIDTSVADPTVKVHFGAGGQPRRNLVLDLSWQNTTVLAHGCTDCSFSKDEFPFTVYATEDTAAGTKEFSYDFYDGSVSAEMVLWGGNVCVNDLCVVPCDFWSRKEKGTNTLAADGVLGLANAEDTFANQMYLSGAILDALFSISYDPVGPNSVFTLGGVDWNYYAPGTQTYNATAYGKPEWQLGVNQIKFGEKEFSFSAKATIEHNTWDFELPIPVFNAITNYYISENPTFIRDDNLMLSAPHACPDFDPLEFMLDGYNGEADFRVSITSQQYSAF